MKQRFEKIVTESYSQTIASAERAQGAVQQVDTVGREIIVLLPTGLAAFDVPCDCPIYLRSEPIKLRMIQPCDQVRITFADRQGVHVAQLLEVQPDTGFACFCL